MDRWINNNWFVRIIALFLALLLYISAPENTNPLVPRTHQDRNEVQQQQSGKSADPASYTERVVTGIPIKAVYDDERYIVYNLPSETAVTLKGPISDVTRSSVQKDFEVYADLEDLKQGTHKIKLKYRNLNPNLKMDMNPSDVSVTIERKVTKSFPVQVDIVNADQISPGYEAGTPAVKPKTVEVTGPERDIERIAEVKARVNLQGAKDDISQTADITLYDKNGNIVPATKVSPSSVSITVPVTSPGKQLPVSIVQSGTPKDGITIKEIKAETDQITAYGPEKVLSDLKKIDDIPLDVSGITDNATVTLDVPVPDGATEVYPKQIKVRVTVDKQQAEGDVPAQAEKQETKVLKGIPIKTTGLESDKTLDYISPSVDAEDITVTGTASELNKISSRDFSLSIDASGLEDGEHTVKINASGPKTASWKLSQEEAKIQISSQQTDSSQS